MDAIENLLRENVTVACIGDGLGAEIPWSRVREVLIEFVRDGAMIFVTRGSFGFEAECAKILREIAEKHPYISLFALIESSEIPVCGKEFYDAVLKISDAEKFLTEHADGFVFGNIKASAAFYRSVSECGVRAAVIGTVIDEK